jgi:Protein of unknown function (DUF3617)
MDLHKRLTMPAPRTVALLGLAFATVLASAAAPALAAPMRPGMWELVNVDGKPQTVPAARECVSQADVEHATKTLPRPAGACELTNIKRSAERATYDLVCRQDLVTTQGRADIVFAGDRYQGKVDLVIAGKSGGGVPVAMTIDATRVGDCTP